MAEFNCGMRKDEKTEDYIVRICFAKVSGKLALTWQEVANVIYQNSGVLRSAQTYRKKINKILNETHLEEQQSTNTENEDEDELAKSSLSELIQEYKKIRCKVADERTQNNAYVRRISREETLIEIAKMVAEEVSSKKSLLPVDNVSSNCIKSTSNNEAILQLSDWHYGIEVNNYWNTFNPNICLKRVLTLQQEVIKFCTDFDVKKLHIVNLSDLIAGRIHSSIRLQSRIDVITQTIEVAEILAEFITTIIKETGVRIEYYDCLDNHSRLEPIKTDSLELESLVRIIPWYLKERVLTSNFVVNSNHFSDDIITFDVMNGKYLVAGVHGHKDRPGKVVDNLTLMTKIHYDLILTAHLHHFSCDEKNETVVVSNGSLMGTDSYAKDLRLSATPSQNIILVTEKSVADYIHRIVL